MKTKRIYSYLEPEVYDKIKKKCDKEDIPIAQMVRNLIFKEVKCQTKKVKLYKRK